MARDHALGEEPREGLLDTDQVHVRERLHEAARVHQVQDRVLDAADVLVDRHPHVHGLAVPRRLVIVRVAVAQEVPGRVDERVHRVGLAAGRPPHFGQVVFTQSVAARAATALRLVVVDVGQLHSGWSSGTGTRPSVSQSIGIGQPQ